MTGEIGQSTEGENIEASGSIAGPSSVPSISISMVEHQQVEGEAPVQQEILG